jgi:copper(I)-binding protein
MTMHFLMSRVAPPVLLLLVAASVAAQTGPAIAITDAWARRAPAAHGQGQTANGAVYMTIANRGAQPDALVSATSDAAKVVELHEVRHEGGAMAMRPIPRMPLPAGGSLELKPGGYHVMLLGLTRHLHAGDKIKVTLTFENAAPLTVEAPVR